MPGTNIVTQDYSSDARLIQPDEFNIFKKLITPKVTSVSTDYTIVENDGVILADTTSASLVVTLPDVSASLNKRLWVKNISTNVLSVETLGTEKIDNASSQSLIQDETLTMISDASNWWIL